MRLNDDLNLINFAKKALLLLWKEKLDVRR